MSFIFFLSCTLVFFPVLIPVYSMVFCPFSGAVMLVSTAPAILIHGCFPKCCHWNMRCNHIVQVVQPLPLCSLSLIPDRHALRVLGLDCSSRDLGPGTTTLSQSVELNSGIHRLPPRVELCQLAQTIQLGY